MKYCKYKRYSILPQLYCSNKSMRSGCSALKQCIVTACCNSKILLLVILTYLVHGKKEHLVSNHANAKCKMYWYESVLGEIEIKVTTILTCGLLLKCVYLKSFCFSFLLRASNSFLQLNDCRF